MRETDFWISPWVVVSQFKLVSIMLQAVWPGGYLWVFSWLSQMRCMTLIFMFYVLTFLGLDFTLQFQVSKSNSLPLCILFFWIVYFHIHFKLHTSNYGCVYIDDDIHCMRRRHNSLQTTPQVSTLTIRDVQFHFFSKWYSWTTQLLNIHRYWYQVTNSTTTFDA